jgi:hypothetical protein
MGLMISTTIGEFYEVRVRVPGLSAFGVDSDTFSIVEITPQNQAQFEQMFNDGFFVTPSEQVEIDRKKSLTVDHVAVQSESTEMPESKPLESTFTESAKNFTGAVEAFGKAVSTIVEKPKKKK